MTNNLKDFISGFPPPLQRWSTGLLSIDLIMGGGLPIGKLIEVHGTSGCGKSTLALQIIASLQKQGVKCAYIDLEAGLSTNRLQELGVAEKDFTYISTCPGEIVMEYIFTKAVEDNIQFVVIDSVPNLLPAKVLEAEVGSYHISPTAVLLARYQHQLISAASANNMTILFLNQVRTKISSYGGGQSIPGGQALGFMCTTILQVSRQEVFKDGEGKKVLFNTVKNRVGPEQQSTSLILGENGLCAYTSMRECLEELDLLKRAGAWYSFSPTLAEFLQREPKIGQGAKSVNDFFKTNQDAYNKVYKLIVDNLGDLSALKSGKLLAI